MCWTQLADKPSRPHWRYPGGGAPGPSGKLRGSPGPPNPMTGKPSRGRGYAAAAAHCETVLRGFYDLHLEAGTGPMVNPFPVMQTNSQSPEDYRAQNRLIWPSEADKSAAPSAAPESAILISYQNERKYSTADSRKAGRSRVSIPMHG